MISALLLAVAIAPPDPPPEVWSSRFRFTFCRGAALAPNGKATATCRATLVAVKEGHTADHRW